MGGRQRCQIYTERCLQLLLCSMHLYPPFHRHISHSGKVNRPTSSGIDDLPADAKSLPLVLDFPLFILSLISLQSNSANFPQAQSANDTRQHHPCKGGPEAGSIAGQERFWRALLWKFRVFGCGC